MPIKFDKILSLLREDDFVDYSNIYLRLDGSNSPMTGNLDMGDNSLLGINNIIFTDVDGQVAGIANKNLLDKSATETITGRYTHQNRLYINYSVSSSSDEIANKINLTNTHASGKSVFGSNIFVIGKQTVPATWFRSQCNIAYFGEANHNYPGDLVAYRIFSEKEKVYGGYFTASRSRSSSFERYGIYASGNEGAGLFRGHLLFRNNNMYNVGSLAKRAKKIYTDMMNLTIKSSDPSTPDNGDVWLYQNGATRQIRVRMSGVTYRTDLTVI